MQDNFNLKGFLRNNKLLNEGIGGYFDLKPLKEDFQDFIERVHQELTPEESAWLVDNVDDLKAKFPKQFARLEGDVDGMTALVKQLYFEKDADSEMNELNDLGNMEEEEESSQIFDKGWQYDDDDYTSSSNEFDFEDFDNSDLNGPSTEMVIDDLIGEFEQLIKSQVPEELHDSARTAVKELWKDKLASWGI